MINAKYVRAHLEEIKASLAKRKSDFPLDELLRLDEETRKVETELQKLRAEHNKGSREISEAKKAGKDVNEDTAKRLAELKGEIEELEKTLPKTKERLDYLLLNMPNILHESVPYGKDDSGNVEIKRVGEAKPRKMPSHDEILTKLDMVDLEQAAKVAGARFFYLKGDIALLEQSLIRFAIDRLVAKGYTLVAPPLMLKKDYLKGAVPLGDFEDMLYMVAEASKAKEKADIEHMGENLYLIGTAEHPLAALYANHVFSAKELPKKFVGWSPCFRREAGAHGKDTKGIFRVHQFYKVEQFIYSKPEESWEMHEELLRNEEGLFKELGLPYRVVNICTGDIGIVAAKKYDIEVYMPGQGRYREACSCSNCTDWQSLRLDIKYDEGNERRYVHTLNATAIATNRTIVAIAENYYNDDGTITVPEALVPYMGKRTIGKR